MSTYESNPELSHGPLLLKRYHYMPCHTRTNVVRRNLLCWLISAAGLRTLPSKSVRSGSGIASHPSRYVRISVQLASEATRTTLIVNNNSRHRSFLGRQAGRGRAEEEPSSDSKGRDVISWLDDLESSNIINEHRIGQLQRNPSLSLAMPSGYNPKGAQDEE